MRILRLLLFATAVTAANVVSAAEVVRAGRWELHSSFWMNLHQALMHDATAPTPRDLGPLTPEQKAAWTAAVAAYREAGGSGNITFARPMVITQDELSQVADDALSPGLRGPLADSIRQAAPVYRAHWWAGEDAANRFFIGYAAAMLRDAGEELARAHEAVYRDQLPKSIRADIAGNAGRFGAYSLPLRNGGFVVTMSSRDAGFQGLAALEMMLHESSHSIVWPGGGTVGTAITAASKKIGIEPP
ncbi:MAG TPA: hypothetical protein VMS98_14060, partial [Thermoanaerobaculia bacterium]|nr:hypothetical protein [Thermoanaerobaculia bacterium]